MTRLVVMSKVTEKMDQFGKYMVILIYYQHYPASSS